MGLAAALPPHTTRPQTRYIPISDDVEHPSVDAADRCRFDLGHVVTTDLHPVHHVGCFQWIAGEIERIGQEQHLDRQAVKLNAAWFREGPWDYCRVLHEIHADAAEKGEFDRAWGWAQDGVGGDFTRTIDPLAVPSRGIRQSSQPLR